MLLLVGLGNPGPKYENNRHNIGFMAVDNLIRRHSSFTPWKRKFNALISEGRLDGPSCTEKVILLKPQTYMNDSGQAVGEALRFYKLSAEDVIVIYDELDIAPGRLKIKTGGGHGGHNGLRSLDAHIGKDYHRIRLGIGHPGDKNKVASYVLGDFPKADQKIIEPQLEAVIEHLPNFIHDLTTSLASGKSAAQASGKFMTKVSVQPTPPKNKATPTPAENSPRNHPKNDKIKASQAKEKNEEKSLTSLAAAFQMAKDKLNNNK